MAVLFRGLIPATVTPMNEKFEVVDEDLRRYMEWITKFRIGGLAINVDTGEGPNLTTEERKRVLRIVSSVVKGNVPIVAGVPPASTEEAARSAVDSRNSGSNALLVFPNPAFYGKPLPAELPYHYHKAIASSGLPIVVFQLQPDLGGYDLTEEILLKLIEIPEVAAIKEASFDARKYYQTLKIVRNAPRKISFLTGNDNFILESFLLGADGALIGFGTLATESQIEMIEKVKRGDYKDASEIWDRLRPLMDAIFKPPVRDYRARTKVALALQNVIENTYVRPPLIPISSDEVERVKAALIEADVPLESRRIPQLRAR